MKIILLNAPPQAGKDQAAIAITTALNNLIQAGMRYPYQVTHHKVTDPLKRAAMALYGVPDSEAADIELNKDEPLPHFDGKTMRQVINSLSHSYVKPHLDREFLIKRFIKKLNAAESLCQAATGHELLCICSDFGHPDDLQPLIESYGKENLLLMHIVRPEHNFAADTRQYITCEGVRTKTIINRATLEQLQLTCIKAAGDWLEEVAPAHYAVPATSA